MILDYWKKITRPKIIEATNFLTDLPDSMRYLNTLCTFWTNNDEMLKMCLVIHEYCLHSLYDTLQIYASDATKKKITAPKLIHVILETNINRIIAVHSRTFFAYVSSYSFLNLNSDMLSNTNVSSIKRKSL